jgi:hypothetical protein
MDEAMTNLSTIKISIPWWTRNLTLNHAALLVRRSFLLGLGCLLDSAVTRTSIRNYEGSQHVLGQ